MLRSADLVLVPVIVRVASELYPNSNGGFVDESLCVWFHAGVEFTPVSYIPHNSVFRHTHTYLEFRAELFPSCSLFWFNFGKCSISGSLGLFYRRT